jgi:ABC-type bacteriocin/lantibiotic exporter with double-glycine peptidase domain
LRAPAAKFIDTPDFRAALDCDRADACARPDASPGLRPGAGMLASVALFGYEPCPAKGAAEGGRGDCVIRVENLSKQYGERTAVDDISFSVERGEVIGFLGPNGAGKSTTLRMLTGYLTPNAGRIVIDGVDAVSDPVAARKLIGYLPESVPLYR